ncbi:hypothetical protein DWW36_04315 [Erysipelotrichaceae bacterium AF15-26LB]|nr:hypothetical protein [[Clostridium] innocuum]RJV89134.1 hypothetical protein DWX45_11715 [Erysipelotrichaceae bacterium AF19-24AC]RJV91541.1 hypothetical protein DWW36_04315 [Erysipelotrichaceae bacterium AF15-26LB]
MQKARHIRMIMAGFLQKEGIWKFIHYMPAVIYRAKQRTANAVEFRICITGADIRRMHGYRNDDVDQKLLRNRQRRILIKMRPPYVADYYAEDLLAYIESNKKADGSSIKIIQADEIDKGYVKEVSMKDLRCYMEDKE